MIRILPYIVAIGKGRARGDWRLREEMEMLGYVQSIRMGNVREALIGIQLWKIESEGEDRKIDYLATLQKHTQAVNVVRWAPKGIHAQPRHIQVEGDEANQSCRGITSICWRRRKCATLGT